MSPSETELKSSGNANSLEVVGKDDNGDFIVKDRESGNICTIQDTYAETCSHMGIIHSEIR